MAVSKRVRILLIAALCVVTGIAVTIMILIEHFQPRARDYVMAALRERYRSEVTLGNLHISLFPGVHATGDNLELHFGGRKDLPALVQVRHFTLDTSFINFFRNPKRITRLNLEGTVIHIPPHNSGSQESPGGSGSGKPVRVPFLLNEVIADGTRLESLPGDPSKLPLIFHIRELTLHSVGIGEAMTFHARLQNPKPPGFIHSDGQFGPWEARDPGETPVSGKYTFRDADLGVFHGISGTLASAGKYQGKLDRIEVQGTTEAPNFALSTSDHPMPLRTEFQVTVDAINGNTVLHPVKALLGGSRFEVSGTIERSAVEEHKTILLDAKSADARLDDFLRLAVKASKPPMTGRIAFTTTVRLPPGKTDVVDRLQLRGTFSLSTVRFTSPDVQAKVAGLSHRAEGHPDAEGSKITADFRGRFAMRDGRLALPDLDFRVPGADVRLAGTYAVRSGDLDFNGTARLAATVSEMTTGIKRVLLKPMDPLFRHDGAGTVLPIKISGTRGQPSFRLDIGRVLRP